MARHRSEARFTKRQREVVELIAAGCSNDEIGRRLGISPRTAKAHCDVLRQKLGVGRRRQIPAAYRLLTGEDPLMPDAILRGEVRRRRLEEGEALDTRISPFA
ncbi:MAG: helix-turn-helix transcriptional regulator [Actinomycetota bacterium]|nr:helix-turn-helix transcriptional regulator [Actinomycetota bacterium]